jgi:hypothetical protein
LVTVAVSGTFGTPTGNVSLTVNGGTAITQALYQGSTTFALAGLAAGTYNLSASYDVSGNGLASSNTGTLTVNKYAFSYTIGNDSQTYGTATDLAADLPATILTGINGENLAISDTSSGDSGTAHVGSYDITGTVSDGSGLASDYSVTLINGKLTVNPYALTYTIGNDSQTYGGPAADLAADLPGAFTAGVNGQNLAISYSSTGDTGTAHAGSYDITGSLSNGTGRTSDYSVTLNPGTLTVSPYAFSYTAGNDSQTYGTATDLAADLPATILTGINGENLAISYTSSGDTGAAHVGSYDITGTLADGSGLASDYSVTLNPGTLTVSPYAFSYTIGSDTQTYGTPADLAADLPATFLTGFNGQNLDITYASSGDTATAHVGTSDITGTVSDGSGRASDYRVTLNPGTLTVNPYAFSYTIGNDTQTYGTAANLAADLPGPITTGVNGQNLAISYSSTGDTGTANVGAYDITGTLSDGTGLLSDYTVTLNPGKLTVNPSAFSGSYTIGNDSQTYGTPANLAADLPATIVTGINGQNLAISYSSTGDTATAHVGSYAITGTLSNGTGLVSNYSVTLNPGTLTVNPFAFSYALGTAVQIYGTPVNLAAVLPATISTGVNGQTVTIAYASSGDNALAPVGTYAITGSLGDGTGKLSDYRVTLSNGVLLVVPAGQPAVAAFVPPGVVAPQSVAVDLYFSDPNQPALPHVALVFWGDSVEAFFLGDGQSGFIQLTHRYSRKEQHRHKILVVVLEGQGNLLSGLYGTPVGAVTLTVNPGHGGILG